VANGIARQVLPRGQHQGILCAVAQVDLVAPRLLLPLHVVEHRLRVLDSTQDSKVLLRDARELCAKERERQCVRLVKLIS
jgi:hypothetical protein